ncbi:MAG: maleylpyruvate isomerase N-terminal domain-containing protein [Dehalococcoidales bacterium]|nr:maleylpyruvate isomerase N-terminal domain-containing protein [Dehalococcoidales bacterium]
MEHTHILAKMAEGHERITEVLAGRNEAELERPLRSDGWSAKDILAHIAMWYEFAAQRLRLIAAGRSAEIRWLNDAEVDALNDAAYQRDRTLTTDDVRQRYEQSFEVVYGLAASLGAEVWNTTDFPVAISHWLPNCTFAHEEEHEVELRAGLSGKGRM